VDKDFCLMRRFFPVLLLLPLLASCGPANAPSAGDKVVFIKDRYHSEFNCTKKRVSLKENNFYGVKKGWHTIPELRNAKVAAGSSAALVEDRLEDLLEDAESTCF